MKFVLFFKFLARAQSIWIWEVIFCLLSSKIGKYNFVCMESEDNSVFEREFICPVLASALNSEEFWVWQTRPVNSVFSCYTRLHKPWQAIVQWSSRRFFSKDKFRFPWKRQAISLRPHDRTMELRLEWW